MSKFLVVLCMVTVGQQTSAQSPSDNSNLWTVHRDAKLGFVISFPPGWLVVPARGANVRFSVSPPDGPGNCNVVARPNAVLNGMDQMALGREIQSLPLDQSSWAGYVGAPVSQVRVIDSRRGSILNIPALVGTVEVTSENLEGKFMRKQMVALTLAPGFIWTLNCGATSFNAEVARSRFSLLQVTFNKVFGSFRFLQ